MAFVREDEKKGLSLPGLIDIVFLLLIFSLVTLSVSQNTLVAKKTGDKDAEFDLPETANPATVDADELLQTLLLQIEHQNPDDLKSPKVVYTLLPSLTDSITVEAARAVAARDSLFAPFPDNFLDMSDHEFWQTSACRLIRESITSYKENHFFRPDPTNSIEIRAVKNTEFRIVNYILEFTSTFGDTIPKFMIRTLSGNDGVALGI
jgi:biopolymer transport protein ExbD